MFFAFPLALLLGWGLDCIFGDPVSLPHPVVGMGKVIAWGEHRLNRGNHRRLKGGIFAILCILATYGLTSVLASAPLFLWAFLGMLHKGQWAFGIICFFFVLIQTVLVFYCLAGHTLRKEVKMTFEAVNRSVDEGRRQVARIVGRDTSTLSAQEIRTAALETLAENLSDGVVAPLFWLTLLGVPGMVAYKMVNTLDSMIGYRTDRYREFGCVAARIDDAANYVPARLTALLIVLVGRVAYGVKGLLRFVATYGPRHLSPNSGWPEAALAGLLGCRFGGTHDYFGQQVVKPYIGNQDRLLCTEDMEKSLNVAFVVECIVVVAFALSVILITCLKLWILF